MAANPGTKVVAKIIFPTGDMASSAAFYRSLGFDIESFDPRYAWVRNAGEEVLHLAAAQGFDAANNHAAGYFHVQDVDAWHAAWMEAGVAMSSVEDLPWGMREFSLRDPSNNLLRVGQNL